MPTEASCVFWRGAGQERIEETQSLSNFDVCLKSMVLDVKGGLRHIDVEAWGNNCQMNGIFNLNVNTSLLRGLH